MTMAKPTLAEKDNPWSPSFEPRIEITPEFLLFSVHPVKYRPFNCAHRLNKMHPQVSAYLKEIGATDIPCSFVVTRLQWRRLGVYCTLLSEQSPSDYVDSVFAIPENAIEPYCAILSQTIGLVSAT